MHTESRASFHVGPLDRPPRDRRFWCYGCGARGDAADLTARELGQSREALVATMVRSAAVPSGYGGDDKDIGF